MDLSLIPLLRSSFLLLAAAILTLRLTPPLAQRFLAYGSRISSPASPPTTTTTVPAPPPAPRHDSASPSPAAAPTAGKASTPSRPRTGLTALLTGLLDRVAGLRVPHAWFASFYAVSLAMSAFWAAQVLVSGRAYGFVVVHSGAPTGDDEGMTARQVGAVWGMMVAQGARRLYECLCFGGGKGSEMFVGHWAMGTWFYAVIGLAGWVEGVAQLQKGPVRLSDFSFATPGLHSCVAVLLFILASGIQHDCHVYLASLKKYTVPKHPVFHQLVCPHYFTECLIYLAMAIQGAPSGHLVNRTLMCALVFVAINLGVTADGTKTWYESKFGPSSVQGKWKMIPFVF